MDGDGIESLLNNKIREITFEQFIESKKEIIEFITSAKDIISGVKVDGLSEVETFIKDCNKVK